MFTFLVRVYKYYLKYNIANVILNKIIKSVEFVLEILRIFKKYEKLHIPF